MPRAGADHKRAKAMAALKQSVVHLLTAQIARSETHVNRWLAQVAQQGQQARPPSMELYAVSKVDVIVCQRWCESRCWVKVALV